MNTEATNRPYEQSLEEQSQLTNATNVLKEEEQITEQVETLQETNEDSQFIEKKKEQTYQVIPTKSNWLLQKCTPETVSLIENLAEPILDFISLLIEPFNIHATGSVLSINTMDSTSMKFAFPPNDKFVFLSYLLSNLEKSTSFVTHCNFFDLGYYSNSIHSSAKADLKSELLLENITPAISYLPSLISLHDDEMLQFTITLTNIEISLNGDTLYSYPIMFESSLEIFASIVEFCALANYDTIVTYNPQHEWFI